MYTLIYRWRLLPGRESEFAKLWAAGTELFRSEQGGLGSRLHRGDDGSYFAYAQWPNRERYEEKKQLSEAHRASLSAMSACVAETYPTLAGTIEKDLLTPLGPKD